MSTIRFYFGAANRLQAVAERLAGYPPGVRVLVLCAGDDTLNAVDRLLWTRNALGFIPHCRADAALAGETPILLATGPVPATDATVLINLSDAMPENTGDYNEIIEVVSHDEADRASARERFRSYRALGHPVESINLGTIASA